MKMNKVLIKISIGLMLLSAVFAAQSADLELRPSATVRFSPIKKVKLYLTPELRFDYFELDKFLIEAEVKYSPLKYMDLGASYKLVMNFKTDDPTEYIHRFAFYTGVSYKIDRYTPSVRIMIANYDEDEGISNFMRYKAKLDYDIPKLKIDPYISAELYHQLSDGLYKMRYAIGADWRFTKDHSIGLSYKLDDYIDADKVKHIVGVGYTFKF